jgi:hypothetical protein
LGIRSLPDALHPGYRMELLLQLHSAGEHTKQPCVAAFAMVAAQDTP